MTAQRTPFDQLPLPQQAGMLSHDPKFRSFTAAVLTLPTRMARESEAAEYIRRTCNVRSRRDLDTTPHARTAFLRLRAEFDAWRGRIPPQR